MKAPVFVFAFANDLNVVGRPLKSLDTEADQLEGFLNDAKSYVNFTPRIVRAATLQKLKKALTQEDGPIAGFYFAGHAEEDFLLMETEERENDWVGDGGILQILHQLRTLRLVFLNACKTASMCMRMRDAMIFTYFIGTTDRVSDQDAQHFSRCFYESFIGTPGTNLLAAIPATYGLMKTKLEYNRQPIVLPYAQIHHAACTTDQTWFMERRVEEKIVRRVKVVRRRK